MRKQLLLFSIFFIFLCSTVSAIQLTPNEQHFIDTVSYAQLHNVSINVSRYAHERNINLSLILPYIQNLSHPHAPTTHAPTANTTNTTTIKLIKLPLQLSRKKVGALASFNLYNIKALSIPVSAA